MRIPSELIPYYPHCGSHMTVNLRSDDNFVEDRGWHEAAERYQKFVDNHRNGKVLYLELGVGSNTPGIIKFPFWKMTYYNRDAVYACINYGEACAPRKIADRAICINGDAGSVISDLLADIELLKAR